MDVGSHLEANKLTNSAKCAIIYKIMADYMTVSELAKQLGVSGQTIRTWIKAGTISAVQLSKSGKFLIKQSDIERAFEKGKLRYEY